MKAVSDHIVANYDIAVEDFSKEVGRFLKRYLHDTT